MSYHTTQIRYFWISSSPNWVSLQGAACCKHVCMYNRFELLRFLSQYKLLIVHLTELPTDQTNYPNNKAVGRPFSLAWKRKNSEFLHMVLKNCRAYKLDLTWYEFPTFLLFLSDFSLRNRLYFLYPVFSAEFNHRLTRHSHKNDEIRINIQVKVKGHGGIFNAKF